MTVRRDVHQMREVEEALRRSEAKYRRIFENVQDVFYQLDAQDLITEISPSVERFGYDREEMIGRSVLEFYDELEQSSALAREILEQGEVDDYEVRLKTGDGRVLDVSVSAHVYRDPDGMVVGKEGCIRDISRRKRAEEELREHRDRLEELVDERTAELTQTNERLLREIEERRRAEEALQKSVRLLRDTGEMAKVGGWELDLSTKEVSWTEEVGRIHGVEPGYKPKLEEALNFYAPESRPAVEAALKRAAETGEPYDLESLFIPLGSKDEIWVRSLGKAVYSGAKIVKLAGTFQNIDEYKRADEALRKSEERHRILFETIAQGIVYQSADGAIISANPAAERILGLTIDQMQGRTSIDPRWRAIHEDGSDFPGETHPSMAALKTGRKVLNVVMGVFNPKDDSHRWININAIPLFKPGENKPYQVYTTFEDITERQQAEEALRESEEKFRTLSASAPIGIFLMDLQGKFTYVNEQLLEIDGLRLEELLGHVWTRNIHPDDHQATVEEALKAGSEIRRFSRDFRILRPQGEVRWIRVVSSPMLSRDGSLAGYVGAAEDITERQQAEEALRESEEKFRTLSASAPIGIFLMDLQGKFTYV
ncbi:MAG: PAS domain S-box protein, partial [Candidatus Aminicenantes bacterium]|nr:PAS domain S-box protein [Candidatus Aminicenantes bacterium]